jgi:hypothetical protein
VRHNAKLKIRIEEITRRLSASAQPLKTKGIQGLC